MLLFHHLRTAENGWPFIGVLPLIWKELHKAGENNWLQQLQRKHGAIYKMRMRKNVFTTIVINIVPRQPKMVVICLLTVCLSVCLYYA